MKKYPKPYHYTPKNPEKYVGNIKNITMRSSWERKFAYWCDTNKSVLKWNSEGMPIKYWHSVDCRYRNYYIDFFVELIDVNGNIKRYAVEIKPYAQTIPPSVPKRKTQKSIDRYMNESITYKQNQDKWKSAREWAKKQNFEFIVLTEKELGIK